MGLGTGKKEIYRKAPENFGVSRVSLGELNWDARCPCVPLWFPQLTSINKLLLLLLLYIYVYVYIYIYIFRLGNTVGQAINSISQFEFSN